MIDALILFLKENMNEKNQRNRWLLQLQMEKKLHTEKLSPSDEKPGRERGSLP